MQTHLHGVGGVVQQRHVQALLAVSAAAVGAPKPVHLVLEGGAASVLRPRPRPQSPGPGWAVGSWKVRGPSIALSEGLSHLADAYGGLGPRPDAEAAVLQERCVVALVNHDLDAGLRGQQREVVLLLSPEDQADTCGRGGGEARLAGAPASPSPRRALTVGDAWTLRGPDTIEGIAAAIGGVVERLEVSGIKGHDQTSTRPGPVPHRVWPALSLDRVFATGWTLGLAPMPAGWGRREWPPPRPHSPGLAVLAVVAAGEDKVTTVASVAVLTVSGQQSQDVHVVKAVPLPHGCHA